MTGKECNNTPSVANPRGGALKMYGNSDNISTKKVETVPAVTTKGGGGNNNTNDSSNALSSVSQPARKFPLCYWPKHRYQGIRHFYEIVKNALKMKNARSLMKCEKEKSRRSNEQLTKKEVYFINIASILFSATF